MENIHDFVKFYRESWLVFAQSFLCNLRIDRTGRPSYNTLAGNKWVESVIKCYALYLFLPCATRPNGSGHPGRCGNAVKGRTSMRSSAPLSISPEIVGSRLNNGAARIFRGRSESAMEACSMRCIASGARAPRFVIAEGGRRPTRHPRHMPNHRKTIGEIAAAFPRLHPRGTSSRLRSGRPAPSGPRNGTSGGCSGAPALLPLNCPPQGGHYPQRARRIRKAAKPPTAAVSAA